MLWEGKTWVEDNELEEELDPMMVVFRCSNGVEVCEFTDAQFVYF